MISKHYRAYLMGLGYENIFVNFMPDTDANVIVIYDEAAPVLSESAGLAVDQAGLHVLVRGVDGEAVANLIALVYNDTVGFRNDTLSNDSPMVTHIITQQYPARVDVDDRNRHSWTAHFIVRYKNATKFREPEQ